MKLRGFAAMTPERRQEIAARGGRAAQKVRKFDKKQVLLFAKETSMTTRQQRRALERALSPAMDNLVKMATPGIRAAMVSPGASPTHNVIAVVDDDSFLIEMRRVENPGTHVLLRGQLHAELAGLGLTDIAGAFASEQECGHFQVMLSTASSIQSACAVCDLGFTVPGSS